MAGAVLEYTMIHMRINNVDFYSVYIEKERERAREDLLVSLSTLGIGRLSYGETCPKSKGSVFRVLPRNALPGRMFSFV